MASKGATATPAGKGQMAMKRTDANDGVAKQGTSPKSKEDKIRSRAYEKWEAAGCPTGDGVDFWLEAERECSQS